MAQQVPSSEGFFDFNGARIYYMVGGVGPPLVLLHAGIADSRMWAEQIVLFFAHFRVLRYDRRGFGRTTAEPATFAHAEDVRALLDHLGIERASLLGCSQGGTVALDFALAYPNRVEALVLVTAAPSGFNLGAAPAGGWAEMEEAYEAGDFTRISEIEVRMWVDGPHRSPESVDASIRDLVREMNEIALRQEDALGEERETPPAVERLAEVRVPTLVITGELDQLSMVTAGELLARSIPGARLLTIAGVAHMPNMERPEEFNGAVLDFLDSTVGAANGPSPRET